jgi:hypothetical protein
MREMVTVGSMLKARTIPPMSQDFPHPHHWTKTMKPKIPKMMLGSPLRV